MIDDMGENREKEWIKKKFEKKNSKKKIRKKKFEKKIRKKKFEKKIRKKIFEKIKIRYTFKNKFKNGAKLKKITC